MGPSYFERVFVFDKVVILNQVFVFDQVFVYDSVLDFPIRCRGLRFRYNQNESGFISYFNTIFLNLEMWNSFTT